MAITTRQDKTEKVLHGLALTQGASVEVLKTPLCALRANAICERFIGSVRLECLDHMLLMNEAHLCRIPKEYITRFNGERLHQGIGQHIPAPSSTTEATSTGARLIAFHPPRVRPMKSHLPTLNMVNNFMRKR